MGKIRKIKVVQVIADSGIGGGPQHVLAILEHLDKERFEVFLVCPPGWLERKAREIRGVEVFGARFQSGLSWIKFRQIINTIRTQDDPFAPLIIHSHGPRAALLAELFKVSGAKYVYTEHIYGPGYHLASFWRELVQRKMLAYLNNRIDQIIAVSRAVRDNLVESRLASAEKIVVIPNGIETQNPKHETQNYNAKLKSQRAPIIGSIGNLHTLKGYKHLIKAMPEITKHYPLATLEIIGQGPEREKLIALVRQLKIERHVALLGRQKDILRYMRHWNVFVLPSEAETFGIAILEALAAGIPVVASRAGGIPEIIEDKKNGLLVEPGDCMAIARAVVSLLRDRERSEKLIVEGRKTLKDFSWDNVIGEIERVYLRLFT